jgi:hypothetical protein
MLNIVLFSTSVKVISLFFCGFFIEFPVFFDSSIVRKHFIINLLNFIKEANTLQQELKGTGPILVRSSYPSLSTGIFSW